MIELVVREMGCKIMTCIDMGMYGWDMGPRLEKIWMGLKTDIDTAITLYFTAKSIGRSLRLDGAGRTHVLYLYTYLGLPW